MVGGTIPVLMDWMVAIASIPPPAPMRCPVIDFVLEIGIRYARSPNSVLMAAVSERSFGGVLVPWALM
jgi:hypothetical protein